MKYTYAVLSNNAASPDRRAFLEEKMREKGKRREVVFELLAKIVGSIGLSVLAEKLRALQAEAVVAAREQVVVTHERFRQFVRLIVLALIIFLLIYFFWR